MKVIVLSNHLKAQLRQMRQTRSANENDCRVTYQAELAQFEEHQKLRREMRANARRGRLFLALWQWLVLLFRAAPQRPEAPERSAADDRRAALEAGAFGQEIVLKTLRQQLDDQWCALAGYQNAAGEMDLLVVGPLGVLAIECKHMVGTIHCDQDRWTRDKPARGGKPAQHGVPIADKSGRSPSQQVNQISRVLENALRRYGFDGSVARVVVFSHEWSRLGRLSSPTVEPVLLPELDVKARLARANPTPAAGVPVDAIVQAAQRHHESHQRWLRQRPAKPRARGSRAA